MLKTSTHPYVSWELEHYKDTETSFINYLDTIEMRHDGLIDVLCSDTYNFQTNIKAGSLLELDQVKPFFEYFQKEFPKEVAENNITAESFLKPFRIRGMNMQKYFTRRFDKQVHATLSIRYHKSSLLLDYLNLLNSLWDNHVIKNDTTLYCTISCDPRMFKSLGKLNVDRMSCFREGAANAWQKLALAKKENSFVLCARSINSKRLPCETPESILFRMLGFYDKKLKSVYFFNLYLKDRIGEARCVAEKISEKILAKKKVKVDSSLTAEDFGEDFYINNFPVWQIR